MKMIALVLALLLVGCGEEVKNAPQPGDRLIIPEIEWRVVDRAMLESVYVNSGMPLEKGDRLSGFVGKDGEKWVMYTLPPKYVNDAVTCTVGHEVMHPVLGDYHE